MKNGVLRLRMIVLTALCLSVLATLHAQEQRGTQDAIVTNSAWHDWYGQFGVDLNLLFPKGHSVKNVFPKGQSLGINVAVGKWFSPEFGGRLKVNWGNGILRNPNNEWLAPYYPWDTSNDPSHDLRGQNHRNGGFITFIGDICFNLHNLFGEYRPDRRWNFIVAPRAGGWIHFTSGEGAPVLGLGIINTYRLTDKWRLYADVGWHFIASVNGVASGTGHSSNGYADINVGIEMDLSKGGFHRTSDAASEIDDQAVVLNGFWSNWFAQAGVGMSLINPYGTNFKNVFPNGSSGGINLAVGKWFTPQVGLRGGLNWQNGIATNNHAYYLERNDSTMQHKIDGKGYLALYADVFLDLHHIFAGYDADRRWNAIIYPRMGLAWNFSSSYKECPLLGFGMEHTYRLNDRLKLFADLAYQVTTGGFLDRKFDTGATGTNGWLDINIGVQYAIGNHKWKKAK